ncbi:MAG: hypothetical protein J6A77_00540 [Lachnospiraceae bacterium]|nr:hypothetical protein [Lachnospiraceae bacterium]
MTGYVEKLLTGLEDERVKAKIRSIVEKNSESSGLVEKQTEEQKCAYEKQLMEQKVVYEEQLKRLRQAYAAEKEAIQREWEETLERQKEDYRRELKVLNEDVRQQREAMRCKIQAEQEKAQKLAQAAEQMQERLAFYENSYRDLDSMYRLYCSLGAELHQKLDRVLCADNAELFLAWGVQWENLEALWDFMSYSVRDLDEAAREGLCQVFDYLFETYRKVNDNYERLEVQVGDEFDEDIHTRSASSAVGGVITKILLRGYRGIHNGKIKKSIVLI